MKDQGLQAQGNDTGNHLIDQVDQWKGREVHGLNRIAAARFKPGTRVLVDPNGARFYQHKGIPGTVQSQECLAALAVVLFDDGCIGSYRTGVRRMGRPHFDGTCDLIPAEG